MTSAESVKMAAVPTRLRRRAAAWAIDYLLTMTVMLALVAGGLLLLLQDIPGYAGGVAVDAGWEALKLAFHGGHGVGGKLGEAAQSEWLTFVTPLILALLAAALFQFLYQATLLSLSGRTLGKLAAGIQVRSKFGGRKPSVGRALGRAAITTLTETGLLSIACILVCLGQFRFGVGVWGLAVVGFWANALVGVSRGNRTMGDRVSGTAEFRTGMYARAAEMTVDVARRTSNAASERTLDIARKTSDAVVVAGQLTREGADHIVESELVQRALSSKSAQQVQALGSASVDGARRVAGQVGRRARVAWEERQTGREPK